MESIKNRLSHIVIGDANSELDSFINNRHTIFVTDRNVYNHYANFFDSRSVIVLEAGEEHKNLDSVKYLYSELIKLKADRESLLVGVGGGVVTDITGFVASTYMRGANFGFIPTTLLAQVDASIGGKNGVNYENYKNMVGSFNQPEFIIIDTSFLNTLRERELFSGFIEALKCAIVGDSELFDIFETTSFKRCFSDKELLINIIKKTINIKLDIVSNDEKEGGKRKLLNLGHTLGHAIEHCSNNYNHGEAVAIGLSMIARVSLQLGYIDGDLCQRIDKILLDNGMPTQCDIPIKQLFSALLLDKKKSANSINIVIIKDIGYCDVNRQSFEAFSRILDVIG